MSRPTIERAPMLDGRTLLRQVSIYGVFTIVRRGLNVAFTPIYTHYMSPGDYGILEILNLGAWFASIIGMCKIDAAFYRYYVAEKTNEGRGRVLGASLLVTFGLSTIIVAAGIGSLPWLARSASGNTPIPPLDFYLIAAATWLDLATMVPLAYCRVTDRVWFVGVTSVTQALVSCGLSLFGLIGLGYGYRALLIGQLGGSLAAMIACAWALRRATIRWSLAPAGVLLRYGLPMVPGAFFMYVIGSADRFSLARYASFGDVGVYAVAAKFALGVNLIVMGPFTEMWSANQYRLHASGDVPLYQRTAVLYLATLFLFTLGVAYFAYDFVLFAFGPAYHAAVRLVPLLVLGVGVWGLVPTLDLGSLVVPGKTWIRSAATGAAAAVNVTINLLLVPRIGATGAAIANVAGFVFLGLVTGVLSYPLVTMRPPLRRILLMTAIFVAAIFVAFADGSLSYPWYLAARVAAFCVVAMMLYELAWRFHPEGAEEAEEAQVRAGETSVAWRTVR
ncbi:MAG TPA: oligosaccharide flippase family protein [Candidatus Binatia bacterium]|jgi:O-antigen/teichoic acid export membrane protein